MKFLLLFAMTFGPPALAHGPATVLISWGKRCHRLLARARAGQEVRVNSGPVNAQCGPTCQFEAAYAHLQNITGQTFNLDYLNIIRMRRFRNPQPTTGDLGRLVEDIRWHAGLLPRKAFEFPPDLKDELLAWAASPASGYDGPLALTPILAARIEAYRAQVEDAPANTWGALTQGVGAALKAALTLDQALEGRRAGFNARAYTDRILKEGGWQVDRQPVRRETASELLRFIERSIDGGRNLILHYLYLPEFERAHFIPKPSADQVARVRAMRPPRSAHAVVIDGYRRGPDGRVEWLVIKNSHGHHRYDEGYQYVHVDAFALYGLDVLRMIPVGEK